jgi:hypothetical protein
VNVLQLHKQAITVRLAAAPPPGLEALPATVPKTQKLPYLVVHFRLWTPSGELEPDKVGKENVSDVINTSAYCHSVGGSVDAALGVAGLVRTQLLGWIPTVAGRVCFPVKQEDSTPADPDQTTGATYVDQIDVYGFTSLPA